MEYDVDDDNWDHINNDLNLVNFVDPDSALSSSVIDESDGELGNEAGIEAYDEEASEDSDDENLEEDPSSNNESFATVIREVADEIEIPDEIQIHEEDDVKCQNCNARTYLPYSYENQGIPGTYCFVCVAKYLSDVTGHENCADPNCNVCLKLAQKLDDRQRHSQAFINGSLMQGVNNQEFVVLNENKPQNEKNTDYPENQDAIKKSGHEDCEEPDCEVCFQIAKIHLAPQKSEIKMEPIVKQENLESKMSTKQGKTPSSLNKSGCHKINSKKRIRDECEDDEKEEEDYIIVQNASFNSASPNPSKRFTLKK